MTVDEFAGSLRHRLRLQRRTSGQDAGGGALDAWEDVAVLWGAIAPARPGRSAIGGRQISVQEFDVRIRFREDIESGMRFMWRGDIFKINTVFDMDEHRSMLLIQCTKSPVFE